MPKESNNKKKKSMEISKEGAIKLNKGLAKVREKTVEKHKGKKWYCKRCGADIPTKIKRETDKDGNVKGKCLSCKRINVFVDYYPTLEITKEHEEEKHKEKLRKETEEGLEEEKQFYELRKLPDFLVKTIKEIQNEGVAGEEDTILALIIIAITRLVKNAIAESTNLLLSDDTGIGKDFTTKKTLVVIIPKKDHIHCGKMTPEAFTYWHQDDEDFSWDRKVIHFEDITQDILNCPTFKVTASGGSLAVVVIKQKTVEIPVRGKPCMILTSHHANPQDENLRRFRIGGLDDTEDQTKRILDKISTEYTRGKKNKPDVILRRSIQELQAQFVTIPYAKLIQHFFPNTTLMRTHYRCFLDYICSSAICHQHRREKTENGDIIATWDDYMIARMVLIYTTSNPKMIPMSKEYREILEILRKNVSPMSINELFSHPQCNHNIRWLYRHLPRLTATELIVKGTRETKDAKKPTNTYQYSLDLNIQALPTWNEIMTKVKSMATISNNSIKCKDIEEKDDIYKYLLSASNDEQTEENIALIKSFNIKELKETEAITNFLKERDEERYQRYYKERDLSQYEQIMEVKKTITNNQKAGYKVDDIFLNSNFSQSLISQLIESGQLIRQLNGEYIFGS